MGRGGERRKVGRYISQGAPTEECGEEVKEWGFSHWFVCDLVRSLWLNIARMRAERLEAEEKSLAVLESVSDLGKGMEHTDCL
jgi:hypothetical protein